MTQPPQKIATPLPRRSAPNTHRDAGLNWMKIIDRFGYRYLGTTSILSTVRATRWNPEWLLSIDAAGTPRIFRNRCPHNQNILLKPDPHPKHDDDGLELHRRETITCGFHAWSISAVDGNVKRCGYMNLKPEDLPADSRQCDPSRRELFPWRGLVFELGQHADVARERLKSALDFVDEKTGDLFDFKRFTLRWSRSYRQRADLVMSIVNYLDIDHVPLHAKNLAKLVDTKEGYTHAESDTAVVQWMKLNPNWLSGDDSLAKKYQRLGLSKDTPWGACWVTTDFGLMLEAYPGVRVVSQCFPDPDDPLACTFHHDFYYDPLVTGEVGTEFISLHQALFNDTGNEDEGWCANATERVRSLIAEGRGDKSWGVLNPEKENFGPWFYNHVEDKLAALHAFEGGE